MIYQDKSYKEFYVKLGDGFTFVIDKKRYFILPKHIIKGKIPTMLYFFNNPYPINTDYQESQLTSAKLYNEKDFSQFSSDIQHTLTNTYIDASALQAAFSSNLINKMYLENRMTTMNVIILIVVGLIVLLVILHAFGVIDLYALLTGAPLVNK